MATVWTQTAGMLSDAEAVDVLDFVDQASASASAAATSASQASSSASSASSSATAAQTAQTAAEAAQAAAELALDNFDDTYLGAFATAPTLDNDGDPLSTGDLYFDTAVNAMYVYNGTAWQVLAGVGLNAVVEDTTPQLGGNLDAGSNNINFTVNSITDTKVGQWDTAYGWGDHAGLYEPADATILKDADIGVTVQAYDATILNSADIGVSVQAYDATIVVDADIGVTVQAYDADTAKLDVAQTFTAAQKFLTIEETYASYTPTGTTQTVDTSTGTVFTIDLGSATGDVTVTFSNPPTTGTAYGMTIKVIQGATARAITWPASVDWPSATAPTLTSTDDGVDVFVFYTHDAGTTWYGFTSGQGLG